MRCGLDFLIIEPKPSVLCLLGLARLSPLAEWRRKDSHRDPFVVSRAEHILGLKLRLRMRRRCSKPTIGTSYTATSSQGRGCDARVNVEPAGARCLEKVS